jgi:hypothetical protein
MYWYRVRLSPMNITLCPLRHFLACAAVNLLFDLSLLTNIRVPSVHLGHAPRGLDPFRSMHSGGLISSTEKSNTGIAMPSPTVHGSSFCWSVIIRAGAGVLHGSFVKPIYRVTQVVEISTSPAMPRHAWNEICGRFPDPKRQKERSFLSQEGPFVEKQKMHQHETWTLTPS